ncbi:hypothetical protein OHA25_04900 [Nonomuraea sp. NBC_00507]|uniref:hypothetical protein n=1 Tax=Nonomuraea sp. NBC_00507 TaxID=2976002 RepID=UPI002E17D85C
MRLKLDTSGVAFTASQEPQPKNDSEGRQRMEKINGKETGRALWTVQVVAMAPDGAEVIRVTVAGDKPRVGPGMPVHFIGLEAIPWVQGERNGTAFRAEQITPAQPNQKAA